MNPILAVPAFMAGYIEHSGTGTTDIVNYCKKAGLREPEFKQDEDFRVVIWRKDAKMDEPQFTVYRRCRNLLETIMSQPSLTKEGCDMMGVSESTIKRDIDRLRKTYSITWVGPTLGGRWEVKRLK